MKSFATPTILLLIVCGQSFGQTQVIDLRTTALENWMNIGRIILSMSVRLDMNEFKGTMTLKEALGRCYGQLEKKGVELPMLVDTNAFSEEAKEKGRDFDVWKTRVKYDGVPRHMPAGDFLRLTLQQIPTRNATFVIYGDLYYVEITTTKRANGLSFIPSWFDSWRQELRRGKRLKRNEAALHIPPLQGSKATWSVNAGRLPRAIVDGTVGAKTGGDS